LVTAGLDQWRRRLPGLTFLQLVVGYRTLAELRHAYADCMVNKDEARVLLEILFPKLPSRVWPID
jgi:hypothetical protein